MNKDKKIKGICFFSLAILILFFNSLISGNFYQSFFSPSLSFTIFFITFIFPFFLIVFLFIIGWNFWKHDKKYKVFYLISFLSLLFLIYFTVLIFTSFFTLKLSKELIQSSLIFLTFSIFISFFLIFTFIGLVFLGKNYKISILYFSSIFVIVFSLIILFSSTFLILTGKYNVAIISYSEGKITQIFPSVFLLYSKIFGIGFYVNLIVMPILILVGLTILKNKIIKQK